MQQRLELFGWQEVEVVDDDLGRSGESSAARTGFQRMVAEVCLGNVGAVAAREISRFARNNKDWHHLVELYRMFDTLLVEQDVVYDARRANDRLLLGVKGSLSEYELDLLRVRAHEARHQKAARGELSIRLPVGYVHTDNGIEKDPDRRVQQAVSLVFAKFLDLNSARQTLLWLVKHNLELPVGVLGHGGDMVTWKRPSQRRVRHILTNPMYAGAYAYGKTAIVTEAQQGQPRKDCCDAVAADRGCVSRIPETAQSPDTRVTAMRCRREKRDASPSVERDLDTRVCEETLRVVQPAAIDAAMLAADQASTSHDDLIAAVELELKEARYVADRACKRYEAVDAQNRLVAEELEARWNAALVRVSELESRIETERASKRPQAIASREDFLHLADDLVTIWNDPDTDVRFKKRIMRTVIHEMLVDLDDSASEVVLTIHWVGGVHTELRVAHRKRGQPTRQTPKDVVDIIRSLARVCPDELIAGLLNKNGYRTLTGNRWTQARVGSQRWRNEIPGNKAARRAPNGWMTLKDAAAQLGIAPLTPRRAAERGQLPADHPLPNGPWIFTRDSLSGTSAKALVAAVERIKKGEKLLPGQHKLQLFDT
jgi:DNA invertase Pin-like site-specific DNA recombinase